MRFARYDLKRDNQYYFCQLNRKNTAFSASMRKMFHFIVWPCCLIR